MPTAGERLEGGHRFLAEAGAILATSLDYPTTLQSVAQLGVRGLADCAVVALAANGDYPESLEVAHVDATKAPACEHLKRIPVSVLDARRSLLISPMSEAHLATLAWNEEHLRALAPLEPRSLMAVPLVARGHPLGSLLLISSHPDRLYDRADLQLAEELAHRAALVIQNARLFEAAQRATQLRDEVLGIVAHDLRNPLNAILLQASLLQGEKPAERIVRAVARIDHIIQDLLDVNRMSGGRLWIEPGRVQPRQLVLEVIETQRTLASSASLELRGKEGPDLPEVWADRDRLFQVFENLVGNAVKFTQPGGCITIAAEPRAAEVLFSVSDTGAGIPPEQIDHVFDPMWQAHPTERRGTGLGLGTAIAKGIVEAHRGRIWVESTPGHGSGFCFTVPIAQSPCASAG
jgi:signal transduction histidine kinase